MDDEPPLTILFHHRIASRDGQAVHMEEMVAALRRLGHRVELVGPAATAELQFGRQTGLVAWLKRTLPKPLYELLEFGYNLRALLRLWGALRRIRPDAVYERHNLFMVAGAWLVPRRRLPLLVEVNAPLTEERAAHSGGLGLAGLARWSERYVWRRADHVLPVTFVLADHVAAAGVPRDRIVVIPNGIDPARFAAAPAPETAKAALGLAGTIVLGFTGFVRPWHGLDRVLAWMGGAGRELPTRLLVVGDGPARAALEAQAQALGIAARLTFTGVVGRDEVARHVAAFDVALQPGVTAYASPLKLFEYMALGRAIVAPDAPNIREVLQDGRDALLFREDDPAALPEAVARLAADEALRRRLGEGARETVYRDGYLWSNNAARVVAMVRARRRARAPEPRG